MPDIVRDATCMGPILKILEGKGDIKQLNGSLEMSKELGSRMTDALEIRVCGVGVVGDLSPRK